MSLVNVSLNFQKLNSQICQYFLLKKVRSFCIAKASLIFSTKNFSVFGSILFYPITLEDRRGTTDEFATTPFHLDLFSAALVELAKSIPVHSLILSSHLFFCLPLFLFPFTVPCRIVFAKQEDLETWPNQAFEMRCYRRLFNILYKDHVTNEEVRRKIQAAIGEYDELLTLVKKRKLRWFGHVSRSSGLAKTILLFLVIKL